MADNADKQTDNDFVLKAANSIAISHTARGAGIGAGILLLVGLFFGVAAHSMKTEAECGALGAGLGVSFGLAIGMRRKSEILEERLQSSAPKGSTDPAP
ncbi:MAG: hypothetical protein ABSC05_40650 [Candidatus Solibacter sp.]|jgi:hypothetical protein